MTSFAIKYTTEDIDYQAKFTPEEDPMFSVVHWVSTDGKIVVTKLFLGKWMAYQMPEWKRLRFWSFPTKETAALAGVVAWAK